MITSDSPARATPRASADLGKPTAIAALVLAGIGLLIGFIPPTAILAWLLLLPGAVVGSIGLALKTRGSTAAAAPLLRASSWFTAVAIACATVASFASALSATEAPPAVW